MKRWRRSSGIVIAAAISFVVVGGVLLLWIPGILLQNWIPNSSAEERNKALGSAAQVVLFGLGGVIASVGVTLSILRHREELEGSERDRARLDHDKDKELTRRREAERQRVLDIDRELRSRFVVAVDLLSAPEPIKRSAALYSLGALADDWAARDRPDEVQVCISIVCSYLRAPLPDGVPQTPPDEIEVKTVGYRLIRRHLDVPPAESLGQQEAKLPSWGDFIVDLSGARIDFGVNFTDAKIFGKGVMDLSGATIAGDGYFELEGRIEDKARLLLIGVRVESRAQIIVQSIMRDDAKMSLFGASANDGVLGVAIGIQKTNSVDFERVNVANGGSAMLKVNMFNDHRLDVLDAILKEKGIEVSGAAIDEDGPVTLPDGNRYTISPT